MNKLFLCLFVMLVGCSTVVKPNLDAGVPDASVPASSASATSNDIVPINYSPSDHHGPGQVAWGAYCCDSDGLKRCLLDQFYPLGSWCHCFNQGDGHVCF